LGYASILEVSEMHAYRERLELKNVELAAANRAKSEFLAHMSHELRTPLNAILGFSEMMLRETLGPLGTPRYREYVRDIHDSGAHLTSIIGDILDLSKMEAGKTELSERSIDVSETVNACLRLVGARARRSRIELDTEWHQALPTLRADPRLVKQIILNLLSNAIKFTPANGRVTVWAGVTAEGELALAVRDTGAGIAEQDIPTALAPFGQVGASRTKKHDGTGLGLPLVKSFVELHCGALDIQSRPGVGTTVTVRFPKDRVSDSTSAIASAPSAPSAA
ncbi:MAG: sensor histidine kinase, partial [Kiloniellaceae bacterium]